MERIDASDSRVFAPISPSSPSTPLSLPASGSMRGSVFPATDHTTADAESNRRVEDALRVRDEDISFFDSDVSSVASSSCVPLDDLSDESRPISPPRRPDKLFHHQRPLPVILPKQKSPKRSPSPQKSVACMNVSRLHGNQVDSERLARIRRMKFVRPVDRDEEVFLKDI